MDQKLIVVTVDSVRNQREIKVLLLLGTVILLLEIKKTCFTDLQFHQAVEGLEPSFSSVSSKSDVFFFGYI